MKARLLAAFIVSTTMFPVIALAQNENISEIHARQQQAQAEKTRATNQSNAHSADNAVKTSASGDSGYGNVSVASSQAGSISQTAGLTTLYRHH